MEPRSQNSWVILNKFTTPSLYSKSDSEGMLACPASVDSVGYQKTHNFFMRPHKLYSQNHVFVIISACTSGAKIQNRDFSITALKKISNINLISSFIS